ncbi:MAG: hypothetical protein FJX64_10545 [Alphaproteobacteria bacterium]|nr:hypothetical protein [Alphaproteobacteria bacterium]
MCSEQGGSHATEPTCNATRRRDLLAVSAGYDLTPLLKLTATLLADADTGSRLFVPRLAWSAATDLDVELFAQVGGGSAAGEFGSRPAVVAVRVARYF